MTGLILRPIDLGNHRIFFTSFIAGDITPVKLSLHLSPKDVTLGTNHEKGLALY